jgi:hypothetical protein
MIQAIGNLAVILFTAFFWYRIGRIDGKRKEMDRADFIIDCVIEDFEEEMFPGDEQRLDKVFHLMMKKMVERKAKLESACCSN